MTNIYLNPSLNRKAKKVEPRKECIDFLLNYSKSLRIINFRNLQFDSIQN
jgi:hypothetical protein